MARLLGYEVPDELAAYVAEKAAHQDTAGLDQALVVDRARAQQNADRANYSRAAALYRGEQVGGPAMPEVPSAVQEYVTKRQMAMPKADPLDVLDKATKIEDTRGKGPRELAAAEAKARSDAEVRAEERKWKEGESEKDRASRERAARLSAGQRDRSLDIAEDNAKARREAADAKRRMVSDAQVKAIADYDRGIRILEDVVREKPQIDTGPMANARNWVAQKVGADDPQVSSYKAQVNDFLAQYIRSISGAATTDKERAFLLQNMPKMSDADDVFKAKADRTMKRLRELRALELDLIKRQGKDTSEFEEAPIMDRGPGMPPPPNAKRPQRTVNGETREWDGKVWVPVGG
jgi:hypothetical protein